MKIFRILAMIMFALTIGLAIFALFNAEARYNPVIIIIAIALLVCGFFMQFIARNIKRNLRD